MSTPTPGRLLSAEGHAGAHCQKLRDATIEAMKTPAVREKLEAAGLKIATDDQTATDYLWQVRAERNREMGRHHHAGGISID